MSIMTNKTILCCIMAISLAACGDDSNVQPVIATVIEALGGEDQVGQPGSALAEPLTVLVRDDAGNGAPDVTVSWSVISAGGSVSPAASVTNGSGRASTTVTLGPAEGEYEVQAAASGLAGSPVVFTATAVAGGSGAVVLSVVGGGNNVPERYSSDLWVHGNHAYTGTWGFRNEQGNVLKAWSLDASGAPSPAGLATIPGIGIVSDVQVSDDGEYLVLSGEGGSAGGIYTYGLSNPAQPTLLGSAVIGSAGVHTVTWASIGGRDYAFAALNPGFSGNPGEDQPALLIYDVTQPATPTLVHREPIEDNYGIHDTFVRDGLAFVFAWDEGVIIYDVGNGLRGGSPSAPVKISQIVTSATSMSSPAVHNGWWFHNPVTGERRYLFVGQEGPGVVGSQSSGDIHVVDVSDLANPREVAFFHLNGAGAHNFWMDEGRQVLYAAFYNGGVVALDVSGTLSGDLSNRLLSQVRPGGARNTFTWGVQLANGSLYAIDMLSGLWQLRVE
jgi:hypothetical protein